MIRATISGRDGQSILNVNGGTVDAQGNFSFKFSPADNAIQDQATVGSELHILLIEWTYQSGNDAGKQEFQVGVRNVGMIV